jgi:hypothetical protein
MLSRSVLRIAGDGHVEGAGGSGGSSPANVPAVGAHEREQTGSQLQECSSTSSTCWNGIRPENRSPTESGRAPPARDLASPNPGPAAALDAPNHSSLTPADA